MKEKEEEKSDYKWIGENDENLAFFKMAFIVFVVIVGLITWNILT